MKTGKIKQRDYWPNLDWKTDDPGSQGLNASKLAAIDAVLDTRYKSVNGIVVVKNGYIVYERYSQGFGAGDAHNVASVTKSIISALIGIAIDEGHIKSVEQKVLEFFPEYDSGAADGQQRRITLRHLLTMTAPFAWQNGIRGREPLDKLRRQRDWVAYILTLLGKSGPLGKFHYNTIGPHLLSAVISRATGLCAREYANQRLFRPLGMREIADREMPSFGVEEVFGKKVTGWIKDPQGYTTGGWGLTMTPRDMARLGFLYLNRGNWDGRRILAESWIAESTAQNANGYGYGWWIRGAGDSLTFFAAGAGGSHIYCTPGKDLVVAIVSKISAKPLDRWLLIEDYIIPSIEN